MPSKKNVSDSISAQNTFSTPIKVRGEFVLDLKGTWAGTIHLQRQRANNSDDLVLADWEDVTDNDNPIPTAITFTSNGIIGLKEPAWDVFYRWGFKTSNYTSGTAIGRIEQ